ncbi:MAG: hypothetical protein WDO73_16370 [Ignavibacteriota bacterium]
MVHLLERLADASEDRIPAGKRHPENAVYGSIEKWAPFLTTFELREPREGVARPGEQGVGAKPLVGLRVAGLPLG